MRQYAFWCITRIIMVMVSFVGCNEPTPKFTEKPAELDEGEVSPSSGDSVAEPGAQENRALLEPFELSYNASGTREGMSRLTYGSQPVEQSLHMADLNLNESITLQQDNAEWNVNRFEQGRAEGQGLEQFTQSGTPTGDLDILIVVDDSGSMAEEQQNLSTKLDMLLNFVSDSNWRISVESTDPKHPCGQHLISKQDNNTAALFADAVTRGDQGSANERGILQAYRGLTCNGGDWLRPQSTVAVLIVSDEDNCSNGNGCNNDPWSQESYLLDHMSAIRALGENARMYGLIWHPNDNSCTNAYRKANTYARAIEASKGSWGAICDSDYTNTLLDISRNLGIILNTQFALKQQPHAGSAVVKVDGQVITTGYRIVKDLLIFDTAPAQGAQIEISYTYPGTATRQSFALSNPHPELKTKDLQVSANGQAMTAADYNYDSHSKSVVFITPPPLGSLEIKYPKLPVMKRHFTVPRQLMSDQVLKITVNDQLITAWSWEGDQLVLGESPAAGAKIKVAYLAPEHLLEYPLFIPQEVYDQVEVYDSATNTAVNFEIDPAQGTIIFATEDFRIDRQLTLKYPDLDGLAHTIDLGVGIIVGSLEVRGQETSCSGNQIAIYEGQVVDLSSCGFAVGEAISVYFEYLSEQELEYVIYSDDKTESIDLNHYQIQVFINDEIQAEDSYSFSEDGKKLRFTSLPADAHIVIAVKPRDS